jgi:hypothetical protein
MLASAPVALEETSTRVRVIGADMYVAGSIVKSGETVSMSRQDAEELRHYGRVEIIES